MAALVVTAIAAFLTPRALAFIDLSFSGGNGTPLSITLDTPLTYEVDATPSTYPILFVFKAVGNIFANSFPPGTSTISYTDDGGPNIAVDTANTGYTNASLAAKDLYIYGNSDTNVPPAGHTLVLEPGTFTTTADFAGAPPADGLYESFLSDDYGNPISLFIEAPEPSTAWMLLASLVGLGLLSRRALRKA